MKLLFDFLPILLFFIAYKLYDIYIATLVAIVASLLQVLYFWLQHRRIEPMHLVTLLLIVVLGGATLWLQDERFIKWKPTLVNWLFALVFIGSHWIGDKPLVQRMLGSQLVLPAVIWQRLNLAWIAFFILSGVANLYVMSYFDTDIWVNFKLFGLLGMTVAFIIVQALWLARYMPTEKPEEP